ncbi:hypothetical protein U9M48_036199 [Paspalum notatum var. saurae]|uniref:Uncharacterized protein n=1 Tax=Paspalum notatum var. saurae TaxID=547442 RepID=A0AAQ3X994_PASNO
MPFGLTNAPATFQGLMNYIFADLLRQEVLVFMDDILIYSSILQEHVQLLQTIFHILDQHKFLTKRSKCSFAQPSIEYLGHVISAAGVATEPSKIDAIQNWPQPKTLKQLRGFLGLTGYYRKFVRHYGIISRPLTLLLKKGSVFVWSREVDMAFQLLKQKLVEAPVLVVLDFSKPFVLETNACDLGVGAVLMQEGHPWINGDNTCNIKPLSLGLNIRRVSTRLQHKALVKLMDLQYTIQYKKGSTNTAADALSGCPMPQEVYALSEVVSSWMHRIQQGYDDDEDTKQLLTAVTIDPTGHKDYTLHNGILQFKGRVWQHILQALHSSGIGGHSGIHGTYHRVKQLFAWPALKKSVQLFVQTCDICQRAKTEHPLPIPQQAWEIVSLDFIEGLPVSDRFNTILVVVDKFTKYGHFLALLSQLFRLHGLPRMIISDRDQVFTSAVWQELFRLSDTVLMMSSSYHPQTDGQTERLNQCLEGFLRCTMHSCPRKWNKWLPVAEHWYNTTIHSSLGRSPFEVLYGYTPRSLGIANLKLCTVPDLEHWMQERELLSQLIQQQLLRAQQRMKAQVDKKRSERSFAVGDPVYLKLQPHVQSSVASRSNQKLAFRYYGPFKVLQKVGQVAYKLELPDTAHIHPMIHVSQLMKHTPSQRLITFDLSSVCTDPFSMAIPEAVLQQRHIQRGTALVSQLLIKWTGLPYHLATWETAEDIKQRFPSAPAWGHAAA